jgi:hypothetical protein
VQAGRSEVAARSGLELLSSAALQDTSLYGMAPDDGQQQKITALSQEANPLRQSAAKGSSTSTNGGMQATQDMLLARRISSGVPCLVVCTCTLR